jgi:hypothetical protein
VNASTTSPITTPEPALSVVGRPTNPAHAKAAHEPTQRKRTGIGAQLSLTESLFAFLVFVLWLALFAGGILVDTEPYRVAISPGGVTALTAGRSPNRNTSGENQTVIAAAVSTGEQTSGKHVPPSQIASWLIVLVCFLPLNLAWTCAAASTLGSFGNRANLSDDDPAKRTQQDSNPYTAAILRGFFVYLFMTSGLLLLDDAPFSNPAPGQYIRLAGFLSLFSFVVSYQPKLFSTLVVWAFHRIQVREGEDMDSNKSRTETLYAKKTTVEVAASHALESKPRKDDDPQDEARS